MAEIEAIDHLLTRKMGVRATKRMKKIYLTEPINPKILNRIKKIKKEVKKCHNTPEKIALLKKYIRNSNIFKLLNFEKMIYVSAKQRAKDKGLEFNLEVDDIIIPRFCPILGVRITRYIGMGKVDSNPSIDRINNDFGYVKGNVMIISEKANRMKNNASIDELVAFSKNIKRYLKNTPFMKDSSKFVLYAKPARRKPNGVGL
jgi:hypothetical protein